MKIGKTLKWIFLLVVCNLKAQNKYSFDLEINKQPVEKNTINEVNFGVDYSKTLDSKIRLINDFEYNSKKVNDSNYDLSGSFSSYNKMSNAFVVSFLKGENSNFNIAIEPFIASENQLKISDLDWLGELSMDFVLSSKTKMKFGLNRNTIFGKPLILPVFAYDYQYSNELNFKIGFPETAIQYANNARNTFSIKNVFNGQMYHLDDASKTVYLNSTTSSFSQLSTSLEYERNMDSNWFVNFKMGYDFNKKYLLQDSNYNTTFDFEIKDACNFGVTIKYKH